MASTSCSSSHSRPRESASAVATRRDFLAVGSWAVAGIALGPAVNGLVAERDLFRISLAQWSLNRAIRAGDLDPLAFPRVARAEFGIHAVEYVNQFYLRRVGDVGYFARLRRVADGEGVANLLIMCDELGSIGDPDATRRRQAVANHFAWVDTAAQLGCHSIRVNAASDPGLHAHEQQRLVADGLRGVCEYAEQVNIDVLVENHGGLSSDARWLVDLIGRVDHPRAGTLPDFGNFLVSDDPERWYDRYRGVGEMMPFARAVSAKSHDFDVRGEETSTDFKRMMRIVLDAGYRGWVGIEYEGETLGEYEGIRATKALLERVRGELASHYE
jgi:sugar phosphate isomerase/epimerase